MAKIIKAMLISALLALGLKAIDLSSIATGGVVGDKSAGIKELSISEMKDIKGGYITQDFIFDKQGFAIALAIPNDAFELGAYRNPTTKKLDYLYSDATSGLCKPGVERCYQNEATFTHSEANTNRLMQYINALGPYTLAEGYILAFTVKKNIGVSNRGTRFTYFTYGTAAFNLGDNSIHPTSGNLENQIVKELRNLYQKQFERGLGGLTIGNR